MSSLFIASYLSNSYGGKFMEFSMWENILLGIMALGVVFWMRPGIKQSMQQSKNAESDWMSLVVPMGFVLMFIIFLVAMV